MSSNDPTNLQSSQFWFCCVCQRNSPMDEFHKDLSHFCNTRYYSNNRASMHRHCYSKFLNEQESTAVNQSEIMHSIVCNHIDSTTCRLGGMQCKCKSEYKELLKSHMNRPHPYTFCGSCSPVYEWITAHAYNIKSVAHPFDYNLESVCFVPLCKEARRELNISNPNCRFTSYNCPSDTANFRYYQGCFSPNEKITIGSITITAEKYCSFPKDFEIIRELGKGSKGIVELARTFNGEYFAIKTLYSKECLDGSPTSNEESIMSSLNHSNIIKCFGGLELENTNIIFLEYASNETLQNRIEYHKGLTSFQTLFYLRQLSSAISYLHSKSIIHRDVKPDNVLLFNAGYTCKLTDFSEATYICERTGPTRIKVPRIQDQDDVYGSPLYFAPEIVFGYGNFEHSDIWSLGILTYNMLCPVLPHESVCNDRLGEILKYYQYDFQRCAVLTMNSFFTSIKNEPHYFKKALRDFINPEFSLLLNKLFDFMLCLDATQRQTASDVLNEILSDRTYQEEYIKEFKAFDCCEECNSLPRNFNYIEDIQTEYEKKDPNFKYPTLIDYGEKCFYEDQHSSQYGRDDFKINIYIHWHYWFCFKFNFRPTFRDFLIRFLMPVIGATNHYDLYLLMYDEESSLLNNYSPQQLDTFCFSSYYCFLSKELLDKNSVS